MTKFFLVLAALFATWMVWPEISDRFAQRWDDLPSLPTLPVDQPESKVTDPDIIFTAPIGQDEPAPALVHPGQGDGGCNRILPNSGRCDALQYHSGALHTPSSGVAVDGLL